MNSNPEGNGGGEIVGDHRLPSLKDEHPTFKVEGDLIKYGLQVTFRFKRELKQVRAQLPACKVSNHRPMLKEKVYQGSSFLNMGVCYSAYEGELISFNESSRVWFRYDHRRVAGWFVSSPFAFFRYGETVCMI